jgi:hypothetical protein
MTYSQAPCCIKLNNSYKLPVIYANIYTGFLLTNTFTQIITNIWCMLTQLEYNFEKYNIFYAELVKWIRK